MKKAIIIFLAVSGIIFGQDFSKYKKYSLFTDEKAAKVGDILTILVQESSRALNNAKTSAGRNSDLGLSFSGSMGDTKLPTVDGKIGTNNGFDGKGTTESNGLVSTRISAVVDTIYANGNLHIVGYKKITINGEEQIIKLSGIVKPTDIRGNNTVASYNIANAEISIEGSGMIDRMQSPGWLTKLFHWLF